MDERQRRARRRKEKLLTFSPGEWLWVIGFDIAVLAIGLTWFPEQAPWLFGIVVGSWILCALI